MEDSFTYNITFVVSPEREAELMAFIRGEIIPAIFNPESPARNPEMKKVVEIAGEKPDHDHGLSIALSAVLPSENVAHQWNREILIPSLGSFHEKFGQHALFFVTLLQNLPL